MPPVCIKALFLLYSYCENENIITHPSNPIDKNDIVNSALTGSYLLPKTTKHLIMIG